MIVRLVDKRLICTNPGRCEMCNGPTFGGYVRGRAYRATVEVTDGDRVGYILAEFPWLRGVYHCAPHFEEIIAADEDIFEMADKPVPVKEKVDA
jgi:hypothetical protein